MGPGHNSCRLKAGMISWFHVNMALSVTLRVRKVGVDGRVVQTSIVLLCCRPLMKRATRVVFLEAKSMEGQCFGGHETAMQLETREIVVTARAFRWYERLQTSRNYG